MLEALQRRSSDVWEAYRDQLATHPDAIELPQAFVDDGWVRVATADDETPIGFSVVIPGDGPAHELDGLFVDRRTCTEAWDGHWLKTPRRERHGTGPNAWRSPQVQPKVSMSAWASA